MHNINVNFLDSHENYNTAFKYICKSDKSALHSNEHLDLREIGSLKTKHCMKAYQCKHKLNKTTSHEKQKQSKVRRLSNFHVCKFAVEDNINTDRELFAKVKEQKEAGKEELANFLVSRSSTSLHDLLSNAWEMESSALTVARKATTRIEVVRKCATEACMGCYNGKWLVCAES